MLISLGFNKGYFYFYCLLFTSFTNFTGKFHFIYHSTGKVKTGLNLTLVETLSAILSALLVSDNFQISQNFRVPRMAGFPEFLDDIGNFKADIEGGLIWIFFILSNPSHNS
jgi:hypothetical protein